MEEYSFNNPVLKSYAAHLRYEEKSQATREKYLHDVKVFLSFVGMLPINKEAVLAWKQQLVNTGYAVRSVNALGEATVSSAEAFSSVDEQLRDGFKAAQ